MKILKSLLVFLFLGTATLWSQDIHFSQFYMSPTNLNPAMTGVMNGNIRLTANYRNQWASVLRDNAFRTYSFAYDQRIPVGRYDYIGVGGTFWGDRAGEADFATTTGKLSVSFSKKMGGTRKQSQYLVVGLEGGIAQRSIDFLKLRWGSQISAALQEGSIDFQGQESGESTVFDRENLSFADLAAGLMWFMTFDENNNLYIGGAYHHLSRPDQSFDSDADEPDLLHTRSTIHAGGEFMLGDRFGLVPGVIFMNQGPSFQVNAGTSLKFLLGSPRDKQSFQIGLWSRIASNYSSSILTDAVILSTRFDYDDISLGFSYDLNVSPLRAASNGQGSFEFAMMYQISGLERRGVYCPNF